MNKPPASLATRAPTTDRPPEGLNRRGFFKWLVAPARPPAAAPAVTIQTSPPVPVPITGRFTLEALRYLPEDALRAIRPTVRAGLTLTIDGRLAVFRDAQGLDEVLPLEAEDGWILGQFNGTRTLAEIARAPDFPPTDDAFARCRTLFLALCDRALAHPVGPPPEACRDRGAIPPPAEA